MAQRQDIEFSKGEDILLQVNMVDGSDVTGWTVVFTCRKRTGDATAIITKQSVFGEITFPDTTTISVPILSTDTISQDSGNFVYDVKRIDAGHKGILVSGNLVLLQPQTLV